MPKNIFGKIRERLRDQRIGRKYSKFIASLTDDLFECIYPNCELIRNERLLTVSEKGYYENNYVCCCYRTGPKQSTTKPVIKAVIGISTMREMKNKMSDRTKKKLAKFLKILDKELFKAYKRGERRLEKIFEDYCTSLAIGNKITKLIPQVIESIQTLSLDKLPKIFEEAFKKNPEEKYILFSFPGWGGVVPFDEAAWIYLRDVIKELYEDVLPE